MKLTARAASGTEFASRLLAFADVAANEPWPWALQGKGRRMTTMDDRASYARLLGMINGYRSTCVVVTALRLGVIDRLGQAPADEDTLARDLGAHPTALHRFLRALRVLGIVERQADGAVALTATGRLLLPGRSALRDRALLTAEEYLPAWAELGHSVLTGTPAFDHAHGLSAWDHRGRHPELNESFNRVMTEDHARGVPPLLVAHDFSSCRTVVDVGGGHGHLLADILARHRNCVGILFDQPHVVAGAAPVLAAAGVAERCRVAAGSFFDRIPAGGGAYILQHILHDWDDERCRAILGNCRLVMEHTARLLVVEHVMPDEPDADAALVMLDLHMMAMLGGRERSHGEFAALLASAGFRIVRSTPTGTTIHVIEASPA